MTAKESNHETDISAAGKVEQNNQTNCFTRGRDSVPGNWNWSRIHQDNSALERQTFIREICSTELSIESLFPGVIVLKSLSIDYGEVKWSRYISFLGIWTPFIEIAIK